MASSARRAQARESIANPRWQSARVCGSGQVRSGHAPSSTGQTREVLGSHHQRPCPSTPSKGAPKPVLLALCKHPCERHLCGGRQRPHPRRGAGPPGGAASLPPPSRCTSHPSPLPGRVSGVAARPAQPPLSSPRTLPISDLERWFHRKIGVPCLIHLTWARRFPGAPKSFLLMHSGLRVKRKTAQRAGGCGRQLPERQMGAVAICCAPRAPRTARARAPRRDSIPRRSSHQGVSPWPRLHKERRRGTSSHLPYCAQACFSRGRAAPVPGSPCCSGR